MNQQEIIEGNKLIAEFMGYQILHRKYQYRNFNSSNESYFADDKGEIVCDKNGYEVNLYPNGDPLEDLSELPFNSSWDWLMPVVEKIEDLGYTTNICCTHLGQNMVNMGDRTGRQYSRIVKKSKILAVWLAVVEFIKWYNEENNQI